MGYYNERLRQLQKEFVESENICNICLDLIEFDKNNEYIKTQIQYVIDEIIERRNYNRIKKVERMIEKYKKDIYVFTNKKEFIDILNNKYPEKVLGEYYDKYHNILSNPEKTIIEYLNRIKNLQIEAAKIDKKQKDEIVVDIIDKKEDKERLKKGYYVEQTEVDYLKQKYGLETIKKVSSNFASEKTIRNIVELQKIEEALQRKDKNLSPDTLANALNLIYELTIKEATSTYFKEEYINDAMNKFGEDHGGFDFIERYKRIYKAFNKYIESLPSNKQESYKNKVNAQLDENISDKGLIMPERFQLRVNRELKTYITYNRILNESKIEELKHITKYMDARNISSMYHGYINKTGGNNSDAKEACVLLILDRMPPVEDKEEIRKRIISINKEYLERSNIDEDYATKLVSQKELITSKKKEYFRMSKFERAIANIDFSRLKQLGEKQELTEKEEKEVRRMF